MLEVVAVQPQFWIIPVICIGALLLGCLFVFVLERVFYGSGGWEIGGGVFWIIGLIMAVVWGGISIPFDSKYHVMYKLSGTVDSVTNTLDSGGNGNRTLTPVVNLSGYPDPIQMSDSRIVTLKGHPVELICTIGWVYQGLDVTHCNIAAIK